MFNIDFKSKSMVLAILLACMLSSLSYGQGLSRLGKLHNKGKIEAFKKTLAKAMASDTINAEAHYWYSVFYSTKGYKTYDIEQAYSSILNSEKDYKAQPDEKNLSRLSKLGIDSITIDIQKRKVEKQAYERAKSSHTEEGYNYFLNFFKGALQKDSVIVFRNEVAFEKAKKLNSYSSYQRFMETYPVAEQIPLARERFERLYFDESTKDGKLSSYAKFISDHPKTHYRNIAEKEIFELSTLSGNPKDFINFINKYRRSPFVADAVDILYHLDKKLIKYEWAPYLADSIKRLTQVDELKLAPFYKHDKYGFIDTNGKEIVPPIIHQIASKHKCELVSGAIIEILGKNERKLINATGATFWRGQYDELEDLGSGVLAITHQNNMGAIHKSGKTIISVLYDDITLINNRLIAYKKNDKWGIFSLLGRKICEPIFDKILSLDNYLIVVNDGKGRILPYSEIEGVGESKDINPKTFYFEWELLSNGDIFMSDDKADYILSPFLKLRFNKLVSRIEVHDTLLITTEPSGKKIYDSSYKLISGPFDKLKVNKSIIAYEQASRWHILADQSNDSYDSLLIMSDNMSVGHHGGTSFIIFDPTHRIEVPENITYRILKNNKSIDQSQSEYLEIHNVNSYKYIYNEDSKLIYEGRADKIDVIANDLIVIERDGKKGMINGQGNKVVPTQFDAIGNYQDGMVSLLRNSKFGLFRSNDSALIPADYDKQIQSYHSGFFIAYKNGAYGIINKYNEEVIPFEFEEIKYWNDSSAFIKKDFDWKLYNMRSNEIIIEHIKSVENISVSSEEIIAKMLLNNNFGLISNTRGNIIPAVYQDIRNMGTQESPFYLAEKNIEEADFYVTIYYNGDGEIIYKQAYEADDFDKIYCEEN